MLSTAAFRLQRFNPQHKEEEEEEEEEEEDRLYFYQKRTRRRINAIQSKISRGTSNCK